VRKLRVLVLMHPEYVPPDDADSVEDVDREPWKTEYGVIKALRKLGHEVKPLGVQWELYPIREEIDAFRPHIVFNLLEEFHSVSTFDHHVASYLELLQVPYTGCNPRGLMLARGKALSKKIVHYHRVRVPAFTVAPRGRRVRRPRAMELPLIVKSLTEEASLGISQASVVDSDEKLEERVTFVHERLGTDAIVEQYIDGRELYVGVLGNQRLEVFPPWELTFENLPPGAAAIATARVKHNADYQEKRGIFQQPAVKLPEEVRASIERTTKRVYRSLELDGYARVDYRLTPDGTLYFLEANPNPDIAPSEEFASAAEEAGHKYSELLQRILGLGLRRGTHGKAEDEG